MGSCRRDHIEAPRGAPAGPSLTVRFMMADNCSRFPAIQSQGQLQLYRWLISHPTRGPFGFRGDCVGLSVVCTSSAKIIRPSFIIITGRPRPDAASVTFAVSRPDLDSFNGLELTSSHISYPAFHYGALNFASLPLLDLCTATFRSLQRLLGKNIARSLVFLKNLSYN